MDHRPFAHGQGMCEERQLNDFDSTSFHMIQTSRRGRLHAGPRYKVGMTGLMQADLIRYSGSPVCITLQDADQATHGRPFPTRT